MSVINTSRRHIPRPVSAQPFRTRQSGFTLLEILVAIVVLSLGLLGLAGLQAVSLNNNQIAYYRAIATQQAYDMGDRMRANLTGVTAGDYDNSAATADANGLPSGCPTTTMALTDVCQWLTTNAALLPGGTGTLRCTEGPADGTATGCQAQENGAKREFDITVMWTEKNMGGLTDPNCPAGTAANIRCFVTRFAP